MSRHQNESAVIVDIWNIIYRILLYEVFRGYIWLVL